MTAGDPHAPYLEAWRTRYAAAALERERLRAQARETAARCARRLRDLGAERVYLYGSLLRPAEFDERSDIDLVTVGLAPCKLWGGDIHDVEHEARPFRLDVRAFESAAPEFREGVLAEGEVLA